VDEDQNCLNTRHEILKLRSLAPVTLSKNKCRVIKGVWEDYYYPQKYTSTKEIDIDHLVPLKHAHEAGGAHWTLAERKRFANDPDNLVITHKHYNRQKGPKTILEWLPVHKNDACKYVADWMKVKIKYQLTTDILEKCAGR
jgi:hypothetical protein